MSLLRTAIVSTATGRFRQTVRIGPHTLTADEPADAGGDDAGPAPHEWLLAGLGVCTSMTLREYATRKGIAIDSVEVEVTGDTSVRGEFRIRQHIRLTGALSAEQLDRMLEIADRCPVHRVLTGRVVIDTEVTRS
jgi:putative redox protein